MIIKVKGISFDLIFEKDPSKININAIPLPPMREFENSIEFNNPVVIAVIKIIINNLSDLYFSSSNGPIRRIIIKLPIRCPQSPCTVI